MSQSDPGTRVRSGTGRFSSVMNWIVLGIGVGFVAGFAFSWFVLLSPLKESIAARERAAEQWDAINRTERQTIQEVKGVSAEEMRKWVATVSEQNAEFAGIQRRLTQQEVELSGPGSSYVAIAALVVLLVGAAVAFINRDADRQAATTLDNIASLPPHQMVRVAQVSTRGAQTEPLNLDTGQTTKMLPAESARVTGIQKTGGGRSGSSALIICPLCQSRVRADNLAGHIQKMHGGETSMGA
jgi:hypothetical protein